MLDTKECICGGRIRGVSLFTSTPKGYSDNRCGLLNNEIQGKQY